MVQTVNMCRFVCCATVAALARAHWIDPTLQTKLEYRDGDTIIAVPAKSGTTWSMNIFHQLRTGGDGDFQDIYREVPWVEFKERPKQTDEELLQRWKAMPRDVPRGFKTHSFPGPHLTFQPSLKYLVVYRSPEEAIVSMKPFFEQHTDEIWQLWDAQGMQAHLARENLTFHQWYHEVALSFKPGPPGAPDVPGGMLTSLWLDFINGWWPLRNEPNVLMLHFGDMKQDHEGTVRKVAEFLGMTPTEEQWSRILEYTGFKWMKQHERKFELATVSPCPILKPGGMIRKGAAGKASEDGMTPAVSKSIHDWVDKIVRDPAARRWMFQGGPLPSPTAATG